MKHIRLLLLMLGLFSLPSCDHNSKQHEQKIPDLTKQVTTLQEQLKIQQDRGDLYEFGLPSGIGGICSKFHKTIPTVCQSREEALNKVLKLMGEQIGLGVPTWCSITNTTDSKQACAALLEVERKIVEESRKNPPQDQKKILSESLAVSPVVSDSSSLKEKNVFPVVAEDDCESICDRIVTCKVGSFFKEKEQCEHACKGASEDKMTSKTYECISQATNCTQVKKCSKSKT